MKLKIKNVLWGISIVLLLILFIINGAEQKIVKSKGTENYGELQYEYIAPDRIHSVIYDSEAELLYVCYTSAPCVNVYTYDGEFLWCAMTEYMGPCYYDVIDNSLIIYNTESAYIYNSKNGSFEETVKSDELDLSYEYRGIHILMEDMKEGYIYHDKYQVYVMSSVGKLNPIIERPDWFALFDYSWILLFVVAVLFFTVATISTIEKRRNKE